MPNYTEIATALAGVCQTAALVQSFAYKGTGDREMLRSSLQSLLVTQPSSTLDVFDSRIENLKLGLETGLTQFGGRLGKLDTEIGRYWLSTLSLSQRLNHQPAAKSALAQRLAQLERQLALYDNDILHEQMLANMAAIYSDIISPLGGRIQVIGSQDMLSRVEIQNRVRALLLAGVRSGILWQQVGGSRWHFFFARRKLFNATKSLYSSI